MTNRMIGLDLGNEAFESYTIDLQSLRNDNDTGVYSSMHYSVLRSSPAACSLF